MGLLIRTVTRLDCSAAAWRSTVIFCSGSTLLPNSDTTWPSTRTQPRAIHSSASRREHRPSSDMRLDRRNNSLIASFLSSCLDSQSVQQFGFQLDLIAGQGEAGAVDQEHVFDPLAQ